MDEAATIERRKGDHLQINLDRDVQARTVATGFERYRFVHTALPELSLADVDLRTAFFNRTIGAPILVSSMTGGFERGWEINQRLAIAAQEIGCALGVGSQRVAISEPERARYFAVRHLAPDVLLFANLGAVQLNYGYGVDECRRAVEMIEADALILHLNSLQEALQPEGNRDFGQLLPKIEAVCDALDVPVIVKEVGCGISAKDARRLAEVGVAAIDVGGAGGTSWSAVEHHRANTRLARRMSETFVDWGIPTATSLRMVRRGAPSLPVIASGGLRTGLDAAKAIALGAEMAGFAGPILRAAAVSEEETVATLTELVEEVRLAMFCTGSRTVRDLRQAELLVNGRECWEGADESAVGRYRVSGDHNGRHYGD